MSAEECPRCGCNAVDLVDSGATRFGRATNRLRCGHCGHTWRERENWPTSKRPAEDIYPVVGQTIKPPEPDGEENPAVYDPLPAEPTAGGAVIFHAVHCPKCGSTDTRVTSTRRPVRHHKCRACSAAFKSVEHRDE